MDVRRPLSGEETEAERERRMLDARDGAKDRTREWLEQQQRGGDGEGAAAEYDGPSRAACGRARRPGHCDRE